MPEEGGDLQKTLNNLGVHYTHRNDELMVESTIEGQRFQVNLQVNLISYIKLPSFFLNNLVSIGKEEGPEKSKG